MAEIVSKGTIGADPAAQEERNAKAVSTQNLQRRSPLPRRRFLGWLGIGLFGAMAAKAIPLRFVSTKSTRTRNRSKKLRAIPNELAVKRAKKV